MLRGRVWLHLSVWVERKKPHAERAAVLKLNDFMQA